jgi:Dolichyl-phosphate-mannose-protein mannosyltransferase
MKTRLALIAVAAMFVVVALLFAARLGIEADEAMIGNGIYEHAAPWYSWTVGGNEIPVMLINYLGALKTWLMHPVLDLWAPGRISLRLPMMLAGALTLWLFFALLDRTLGRAAAWIGTLLLATDPSFLLIEATDFGFVALQFLFKLGALLLLLRFHREGRVRDLAIAFFLIGLALWDKAVFSWVLIGLFAGALAAFPKELRSHCSWRNVTIAIGSTIAGALPLVIYNIARPLETIRSSVKLGQEPILAKAQILWRTIDGYVLFGFLTSIDSGPQPGAPRHWYQTLSLKWGDWTGHPHHDLMLIAFAVAVLALGALWKTDARKPMLFGITVCVITWFMMALTNGAGAAAQHVILLWPFPAMVIAAALSRAQRPLVLGGTAILCLANLAVTNNYYADLVRNGPAIRWTDAVDPLNRYLLDLHPDQIYIADWGYWETLNLLSQGDLPVAPADVKDETVLENMFAAPGHVFVAHTQPFAFQPDVRDFIEATARRRGWEQQHLQTIYDQNGRPTFEVFRFRKVHL